MDFKTGSKRGLDSVSEMVNNSRGGSVAITEEEDATAIDLESVVNVNIAICYLKLDQPFKVIDHCNAAIALKPSNWKAYLRKGEALTLTGDYDKALNTLSHAKDLLNEIASLNTSDSSSNSSSSSSSSIGSSSSGSSSSSSNSTAAMGGQKAVLDALRVVKEKMKLETKKEKEKLSGFLNK